MLDDKQFLFEFIDDLPVGIARADSRGVLPNHYNKFFLEMFGWSKDDVDTLDKWFKTAYPDDAYRADVITRWNDIIQEAEVNNHAYSCTMEVDVTCKDGSIKTCEARYYRKEDFIYGIFVDVSGRKAIEIKYKNFSYLDELTQVGNRKSYKKRMFELLETFYRYGSTFTVLMCDIDDFKVINDTYGHIIGDKILVDISQLIQSHIRESDAIFRVGGEEFVILLRELSLDKAQAVAEKIREIVEVDLGQTISIGLSEVCKGDTVDSIYKRVDDLMYQSKKSGKNRITIG